jgi:hypothetical protein
MPQGLTENIFKFFTAKNLEDEGSARNGSIFFITPSQQKFHQYFHAHGGMVLVVVRPSPPQAPPGFPIAIGTLQVRPPHSFPLRGQGVHRTSGVPIGYRDRYYLARYATHSLRSSFATQPNRYRILSLRISFIFRSHTDIAERIEPCQLLTNDTDN